MKDYFDYNEKKISGMHDTISFHLLHIKADNIIHYLITRRIKQVKKSKTRIGDKKQQQNRQLILQSNQVFTRKFYLE